MRRSAGERGGASGTDLQGLEDSHALEGLSRRVRGGLPPVAVSSQSRCLQRASLQLPAQPGAAQLLTHVGQAPKLPALVLGDDLVQQDALGAVELLGSQAHPNAIVRLGDASGTETPESATKGRQRGD